LTAGHGATAELARRLGPFDATMIVMGGVIGSGILINPYVVARQVHTPALIFGAWVFGGLVALAGGLLYAELAARRPDLNGQYAYLRDAYHPAIAFMYGWGLLLVIQTGGMAAVAITFARYFLVISRLQVPEGLVAVLALALLTAINCCGVRAGSNVQSALMLLKIAAIAAVAATGLWFGRDALFAGPVLDRPVSGGLVAAFGSAAIPVLFAYGGWQTASFMAAELRRPDRDLSRAMLLGVGGVIVLYLTVNFAYLKMLGAEGLAATTTPATAMIEHALGAAGARITAVIIVVSTLGFLSQAMLTAPRVYFMMAGDGLFFRAVARLSAQTRVPATAIALQGVLASIIALSGSYEQILNYVVSVDFLFIGLTGTCVFVFRKRDAGSASQHDTPGHPVTTLLFTACCWFVVANTVIHYPADSGIGLLILLAGMPAYAYWNRRKKG
jgi:APA family basic amino acid/polyamine antiporter